MDIYAAWEHGMKAGRYHAVRAEDKSAHNPNYAAQNHLEYFAELQKILHSPLDRRREMCIIICIYVAAFPKGGSYGTVHCR